MIDLKCKEIQDKQDALDRVELENRIRRRIITRMHLETQTNDNALRKLQQENDDRIFRDEQMRMLAEQDRLELLSNERQRLKRIEHQRTVRQLIADREAQRCSDVFKVIQEHQDYLALEKRRFVHPIGNSTIFPFEIHLILLFVCVCVCVSDKNCSKKNG